MTVIATRPERPPEAPAPEHAVGGPPVDVDAIELPATAGGLRERVKGRRTMHYNRLAAAVLLLNSLVAAAAVRAGWWSGVRIDLDAITNVVLANLTLAIVIRQQYVVNLLFKIATSAPTNWPLAIRWTLGKVYHFGGLHVGGAVAGTIWFIVLSGSAIHEWVTGSGTVSAAAAMLTIVIVVELLVMVGLALPPIRMRHHDLFERSHRYLGWASLLLFWALAAVTAANQRGDRSWMESFVERPSFWLLLAVTVSIALPWMRLRRVPVAIVRPSGHVALVQFDHGVTPIAGSSTAVSRSPLREWHSFANVPSPGRTGFRLTISRAGDWTGEFIDDQPAHVWVKGIPTAGVANIETLFTRVIYVATGSGIGPCLPHLLAAEVPSRLIWATRNARETYGDQLVDEILEVQPDAVIWDTDRHGKPDMVKLAWDAYRRFDAEAVICISNKKLTWQVVEGMERRGIPAYGAIWDS